MLADSLLLIFSFSFYSFSFVSLFFVVVVFFNLLAGLFLSVDVVFLRVSIIFFFS